MGLDLDHLRQVNVTRCEQDIGHPLNDWSVAEWGNATAGEIGEACNIAKKLLRLRTGLNHMNKKNFPEEVYRHMLAGELADALIYIDLWAASEGIDLSRAVIEKFNLDSQVKGLVSKL